MNFSSTFLFFGGSAWSWTSSTSGWASSFTGGCGRLYISLGHESGRLESLIGISEMVLNVGDSLLVNDVVVVAPVVDFGGESLRDQSLHDLPDLQVVDLEDVVLSSPFLAVSRFGLLS